MGAFQFGLLGAAIRSAVERKRAADERARRHKARVAAERERQRQAEERLRNVRRSRGTGSG